MMKLVFSKKYEHLDEEIRAMVLHFEKKGKPLIEGKRNKIKVFETGDLKVNIKSFKVPNWINKIAYSFLRKSKAERSFRYAEILLSKGILTPQPIAYIEETHKSIIRRSFYASEHLEYDLTFREVNSEPDFPQREKILRAFTRFTFSLHENDVNFLDHSPGNTLIIAREKEYQFYLIDLNRMKFQKMNFQERMKNFSRLTNSKEVMSIMANEYAKLSKKDEKEVYSKMLYFTNQFQEGRKKKRAYKRKFKLLLGK